MWLTVHKLQSTANNNISNLATEQATPNKQFMAKQSLKHKPIKQRNKAENEDKKKG